MLVRLLAVAVAVLALATGEVDARANPRLSAHVRRHKHAHAPAPLPPPEHSQLHPTAGKVIAKNGGVADLTFTSFNTLHGVNPAGAVNESVSLWNGVGSNPNLRVDLYNTYGSDVKVYIAAMDTSNRVIMLQPNGQWLYPGASNPSVPQPITGDIAIGVSAGATASLTLPGFFISGRIYFSAGDLKFFTLQTPSGGVTLVSPDPQNPSDPSAEIQWGFAEMTYTQDGGLYADISFVDFIGMSVGMRLSTTDGQGPQTVKGPRAGAVNDVCKALSGRGEQHGPWDQLCQHTSGGQPLRANAPAKYIATHAGAFDNYYADYVSKVWAHYASQPLVIHSQNGQVGNIRCSTSSGQLQCDGASRAIPQPSALDIFGCQGVFASQGGDNPATLALLPRLCAALTRTTLLEAGGDQQPGVQANSYYPNSPTNWYAQAVHMDEIDGRGYAFPYDDVRPDGAPDASGAVTSGAPDVWTVVVGGTD